MSDKRSLASQGLQTLRIKVPYAHRHIYNDIIERALFRGLTPAPLLYPAINRLDDNMSDYFFRQQHLSAEDQKVLDAFLYMKPIKNKKPKMKTQKANPMAPTTFPKFTQLPYELQDIILIMATVDLPQRTIELRTVEIKNPGPLEYASQFIYKLNIPNPGQSPDLLAIQDEPRFTKTFASPTPPTSLLSVSQHARAVAKRHYELAFRPINNDTLNPVTPPVTNFQKYVAKQMKGVDCPNCTCCTHGIWVDFDKDVFAAGKDTLANDRDQQFFMVFADEELYDEDVFQESRLSIQKIQTLAMPIRSPYARNMVISCLGYFPALKELWLIRTGGFDKKPYLELGGRYIDLDTRPPEGKDELVYAARTRGFRVLGNFMHINEAKAVAEMLYANGRLTIQGERWAGPAGLRIWTATVKKREEPSKVKLKAKKVWETVTGRRLKNWMDKNYIPPNSG